jgi:hypothetical protein
MRGLWHQLSFSGSKSDLSGLFLGLRDDRTRNPAETGSLIDACGFARTEKRMCQIASNKEISEAVLVIPYVFDDCNKETFFNLNIEDFEREFIEYEQTGIVDNSIKRCNR